MYTTLRTFCVLVSSTFSDMRSERLVLSEMVFLKLKVCCASYTALGRLFVTAGSDQVLQGMVKEVAYQF